MAILDRCPAMRRRLLDLLLFLFIVVHVIGHPQEK